MLLTLLIFKKQPISLEPELTCICDSNFAVETLIKKDFAQSDMQRIHALSKYSSTQLSSISTPTINGWLQYKAFVTRIE